MELETIWAEYRLSLQRFLHKNIANPDDVDDILQEVLIKTYQSLSSISDSNKVKPWLFQIARNSLIDFYRKQGRKSQITTDELWHDQDETSLIEQMAPCVVPFINALPMHEASLLTAIDIEGTSQKDYAKQHGIKYSTLKSRVKKSRESLQALYSQCCKLSIDDQGNLLNIEANNSQCKSC